MKKKSFLPLHATDTQTYILLLLFSVKRTETVLSPTTYIVDLGFASQKIAVPAVLTKFHNETVRYCLLGLSVIRSAL